jgi:hypothetical protein
MYAIFGEVPCAALAFDSCILDCRWSLVISNRLSAISAAERFDDSCSTSIFRRLQNGVVGTRDPGPRDTLFNEIIGKLDRSRNDNDNLGSPRHQ